MEQSELLKMAGVIILLLLAGLLWFVRMWMSDKTRRLEFNAKQIEYLHERDKAKQEQLKSGIEKFKNTDERVAGAEQRIDYVEKTMVPRPEYERFCKENSEAHESISKEVKGTIKAMADLKEAFAHTADRVEGSVGTLKDLVANKLIPLGTKGDTDDRG